MSNKPILSSTKKLPEEDSSDSELVPPPTFILPYLVLGGSAIVRNEPEELITKYKVKHNICVASDCKNKTCVLQQQKKSSAPNGSLVSSHKFIIADSFDDVNPIKHKHNFVFDFSPFETAIEYMHKELLPQLTITSTLQQAQQASSTVESALEQYYSSVSCNGSIYIHCQHGRSRSTALVLAFLMRHLRISLRDAYTFVKRKRPFIGPHMMLKSALIHYERYLFDHVFPREQATPTQYAIIAEAVANNPFKAPTIAHQTEWRLLEKQVLAQVNGNKNLVNEPRDGLEKFSALIEEEEATRSKASFK